MLESIRYWRRNIQTACVVLAHLSCRKYGGRIAGIILSICSNIQFLTQNRHMLQEFHPRCSITFNKYFVWGAKPTSGGMVPLTPLWSSELPCSPQSPGKNDRKVTSAEGCQWCLVLEARSRTWGLQESPPVLAQSTSAAWLSGGSDEY